MQVIPLACRLFPETGLSAPSLSPRRGRLATMGFEIQEPLQPFMVRSRRYVTRSRPILRRRPPSRVGPPVVVVGFSIPPAMTNVKPNSHRRVARSDVVRARANSFWEVRAHPRLNRSIGIPPFDPGRRRDPRTAPTGRAPSVPPEIGFRPGLTRPDPRPSDPPLGSRVTQQTTATCETTLRSRSSWRSTASPRSCCSAARC